MLLLYLWSLISVHTSHTLCYLLLLQAKPLDVLEATLPALPPWWTRCAPTQLASSSPLPCPQWSCLEPWSPSGSWRVPKGRRSAEPTRGMSSTWGSCSWTRACQWSTAPVTSFPFGYEGYAELLLIPPSQLTPPTESWLMLLYLSFSYDNKSQYLQWNGFMCSPL